LKGKRVARKPDTVAIVVAAGSGRRLGRRGEKAFTVIGDRPLLFYSLKALETSPDVASVVIVVRSKALRRCLGLVKRYRFGKVEAIVAGGRRRQDSVAKGLAAAGRLKLVLIHDAARPLLSRKLVARTVQACRKNGAAIAAVPVSDSVKRVRGRSIRGKVKREGLWLAQTPQVFRREVMEEALCLWPSTRTATDDATMVRHCGRRVVVVPGDFTNVKVTFPEDLAVADSLARLKRRPWE
jgi:2-C-methyl-D-erythritol 4-phosphate cytidylyltransferase